MAGRNLRARCKGRPDARHSGEKLEEVGMPDKVALVTGAGTGIGRAAALALVKDNYAVVLAGRRKEPLEATARLVEALQGRSLVVPTDIANQESVRALFARTKERFGRLDVL